MLKPIFGRNPKYTPGGGLYGLDDASFTQEVHSTVLFENCEATEGALETVS